jgi:hypothetical protein
VTWRIDVLASLIARVERSIGSLIAVAPVRRAA